MFSTKLIILFIVFTYPHLIITSQSNNNCLQLALNATNNCTRCSQYACIKTTELCANNKYLRNCGCCHLCQSGKYERCGGPYGIYGVCSEGLECTVREEDFLLQPTCKSGICKPADCLLRCESDSKKRVPVCGSDGVMYTSLCEMKKYACKRNLLITEQDYPECIRKEACSQIKKCDFVIRGSMYHRTYRQVIKCQNYRIRKCLKERHPLQVFCGTNSITYTTDCQMHIHSCVADQDFRKQYAGKCEDDWDESRERIKLVSLVPDDNIFNDTFPNNNAVLFQYSQNTIETLSHTEITETTQNNQNNKSTNTPTQQNENENTTMIPTQNENENSTMNPTQNENENTTMNPTQNENENSTMNHTQNENENTTMIPTQNENENSTMNHTQNENENSVIGPTQNENENSAMNPTQNENSTMNPTQNENENSTMNPTQNENSAMNPTQNENENSAMNPTQNENESIVSPSQTKSKETQ